MVRLEAERVEIGVEVPARAVGADQHQGMDRIARGLLDLGAGEFDAGALGARLQLVADRLFDLVPIAIESGNEFAARRLRPVRPRPRGPFGALEHIGTIVLQALEECLPLRHRPPWDRSRSGHRGPRYSRHCRHRGKTYGRRRRWHPDGTCRVLLAGLGGSLVERGKATGKNPAAGVNNTLSMLQLRCHKRKELNWNHQHLGGKTINAALPAGRSIAEGPPADASGPRLRYVGRLDANQ